jgi:diguanylate cyclase (GGDEF)-like protein
MPIVLPRGSRGFILVFCQDEERTFSPVEIAVGKLLLSHTAFLVEYLIFFDDAERRTRQLEELRQASLHITSSLDLEAVLYALLESALKMLSGVQGAHIFLYDGHQLSFGAAMWADGRRSEPWAEPRQDGLTYAVARSAEIVVVQDMQAHPLFRSAPADWSGAIIGLPLKFAGKVVGVMNIAWPVPQQFEREDLHLMELLADQAAIAIQNAHLMAQSKRRGAELEALHQASLKLNSILDVETVLKAILEHATDLLHGVDNAHIYTYDGKALQFGAAHWAGSHEAQAWLIPNADDLVYSVANSGEMLPISNFSAHPSFKKAPASWNGAIVAVPLKVARRVAGVIVVAYPEPREFESGELDLIKLLADQAAIALENARLHSLSQEEALTDPLTELPNRRAFDMRLAEEIRRSVRYGHHFCLMMMDLDGFKRINDSYGHMGGDVVLKNIARCLRYSVRDTDFLARYGGDEFVLLLPETGPGDARVISEKLKNAVLDCEINWADAKNERITLSIGVASFPQDGRETAALIDKADKNLYRGKPN